MLKEFIYKISKDIFVISFASLVVFGILEWLEPGFVSNYISFAVLLLIPVIFGILIILLQKIKS